MKWCWMIMVMVVLVAALTEAAPTLQSKLLSSVPEDPNKQYYEEVVVESLLQVRTPQGRQGRTQSSVSLKDGARVAEAKTTG